MGKSDILNELLFFAGPSGKSKKDSMKLIP